MDLKVKLSSPEKVVELSRLSDTWNQTSLTFFCVFIVINLFEGFVLWMCCLVLMSFKFTDSTEECRSEPSSPEPRISTSEPCWAAEADLSGRTTVRAALQRSVLHIRGATRNRSVPTRQEIAWRVMCIKDFGVMKPESNPSAVGKQPAPVNLLELGWRPLAVRELAVTTVLRREVRTMNTVRPTCYWAPKTGISSETCRITWKLQEGRAWTDTSS